MPAHLASPRFSRSVERGLPAVATVAALVLATWLYFGYRYGVWPQPGLLNSVLRMNGQLKGDWAADLSPYHWAFAHALGVLPHSLLEPTVLLLWVASCSLLWAGVIAIAASLGIPRLGALAAGLVLIPTGFAGVGVSAPLFGLFYPVQMSFALSVVAIALMLRSRFTETGMALGLAMLAHPGMGVLFGSSIGLAAFLRARRRRTALAVTLPMLVLGAPSLLAAAFQQAGGSDLPESRRYELLALVRIPHHVLYGAFPASEWVAFGLWVVVLGIALRAARTRTYAPDFLRLAGIGAGVCALGAAASQWGRPLLLVQAQTSRLTPLFVLLAVLAAAAALSLRAGRMGVIALTALVVPVGLSYDQLAASLGADPASLVTVSAVEALLVLGLLASVLVLQGRYKIPRWARAEKAWLAGTAFVLVALFMGHALKRVSDQASPERMAYRDVALRARELTGSGDIILTPPDLTAFSIYSLRAVVVEFGMFRFGEGDREWVDRLTAVTRDTRALDRRLGTDTFARARHIGRAYDRAIRTSRVPICRYRARLVVARVSNPVPPWLMPVYANGMYVLLRPRPGACRPEPDSVPRGPG